ncbi:agmatine deiminase family protein [Pseudoalteromonas tunicata]|uniref:agmatine deiminase family protein n=1 Tax=Pseudoalteromonas tunicata TaxID=314281 RepID=UPI00273EC959|nr:agmatine deiminase family protein [Pseudoalteromonas tunicata]MDP4983437.1 agmatine deiminase family protein [Pseudoalteromonas tunicata]MDP5211668.1 agmatine deiminase family protein [Pseudoalteromonas tunicata]
MTYTLPAEWALQDAIMFTWPHSETDWAPILADVEPVYLNLCRHILRYQSLVLVVHSESEQARVRALLCEQQLDLSKIQFVITPFEDTWARDHGPITVTNAHGQLKSLDFTFNGWGNKFDASLDNSINQAVFAQVLNPLAQSEQVNFVLEGGAIESNGQGTLLTTGSCLLNTNRNPHLTQAQIEQLLSDTLGISHFLWVNHGHLEGDDTDSHIDTLVRFAPNDTLVYVCCDDPSDSHYHELERMALDVKALRKPDGTAYNLISLPWPSAKCAADGSRLPATYANYLIINGAVLVPTYQDKNDAFALSQIAKAYPEHEIIGVDCLPLIHQFGSLHCISMQLPKGFLR